MKKIFFLGVIFFYWCSAIAENAPLYSTYQAYVKTSKTAKTVLPLMQFYSKKQYLSFEEYFTHDDIKQGINTLFSRLKFSDYLKEEHFYKEIINHNTGCLMIAGLSKEKKRISIYVGYVKTQQWLIDSINIEFLNQDEQFLAIPICNVEKLQKKRMEAWGK